MIECYNTFCERYIPICGGILTDSYNIGKHHNANKCNKHKDADQQRYYRNKQRTSSGNIGPNLITHEQWTVTGPFPVICCHFSTNPSSSRKTVLLLGNDAPWLQTPISWNCFTTVGVSFFWRVNAAFPLFRLHLGYPVLITIPLRGYNVS